jgi:hypothetical protein
LGKRLTYRKTPDAIAKTGASNVVDTRALFIMVGAAPNIERLSGMVKLDDKAWALATLLLALVANRHSGSVPTLSMSSPFHSNDAAGRISLLTVPMSPA